MSLRYLLASLKKRASQEAAKTQAKAPLSTGEAKRKHSRPRDAASGLKACCGGA
jgi:hypothetical protein